MFFKNMFIKSTSKMIPNQRQHYAYFSCIVGMVINVILFAVKFIIGMFTNSVAIIADSINNLADMGSAIIGIIGFKIADKPADSDHPFGHGRGEYISGLIVSLLVLVVGFEFTKTSIDRILNPKPLTFSTVSFIILILSIGAKAWLGNFYKKMSKKISSSTLSATSADSFSDMVITFTVALSLLLSKFTTFPLDGYIGLIVSGFIIYSGYNLTKDTISPLLGEAPSPELIKSIKDEILSYDGIIGVHDLIVHTYGTGKYMASIHAEVPSDRSIMDIHEIIDNAENEIASKLDILLVIHMDPVNLNDKEIQETEDKIKKLIDSFPGILSIHDFRIVGTGEKKNVLFDIVISNSLTYKQSSKTKSELTALIKSTYPNLNPIIGVDRNYLGLK